MIPNWRKVFGSGYSSTASEASTPFHAAVDLRKLYLGRLLAVVYASCEET